MTNVPLPRPRPDTADKAFENADQSFSAKEPDCPTGNCNDYCAKCQEDMKKALQGKAFDKPIGKYSAADLNQATTTTFGEMSAPYADTAAKQATQARESDAIAATIFNRSNAVESETRPRGSNFTPGDTPHRMSGVAGSPSQYHGAKKGKSDLEAMTNKEKMNPEECRRMCQRFYRAKGSVEKFANDPQALQEFNNKEGTLHYNRAVTQWKKGGGTFQRQLQPGQTRIGGNDFSEFPM
jgi:hypothetical protein